ncbi:MAG TPA: cobalamin-independent methionine synthase II family protein [Micropepsaceae bacterium]|nr:cobalamin-independent methionine synthase II family protein [Micropepsaceae bacterium]
MERSSKRILTTHVGSLIRPMALQKLLRARQSGQSMDDAKYAECLHDSVVEVVTRQVQVGVDIVDDGEFGKNISWSQYALERLSGFERRPVNLEANPFNAGADRARFREFYAELDSQQGPSSDWESVCVGPITYTGVAAIQRDIADLKAALKGISVTEAFLPVAAPASVIPDRKNQFYRYDEEMQVAIAEAMRTEYRAIAESGILLQLDDARAAVTYDRMVPPGSLSDYRKWLERQIEILNHAVEGIPPDRIRYHVCWGSWPGPHTTDVPLSAIVDILLKANVGAFLIEGANPRHEHEWEVWQSAKLPDEKILIPGVISHATNIVEHPVLIAQRIVRYANLLGRENVIAGSDCGFAQGPFHRRVHPSIMWAKLESMAEGARIASRRLWQ